MATLSDLGALVKAKHPGVYDDLGDAELGGKVQQKFPGSYDDFGSVAGMGDVQAAPSSHAGTGNVPASWLTGDPGADAQIAQNLAGQGMRRDITPRDVAQGVAAGGAGLAMATPGLGPVAGGTLSSGLLAGATTKAQDPLGAAEDIGGAAAGGALTGGAVGLAVKGLQGVGGWAAGKAGQAIGRAAQKAKDVAEGAFQSEVGSLGNKTAAAQRYIENIERFLANPTLTPENRSALEALKTTPEYADAVNTVARSMAEKLPGAAKAVQEQAARVAQMGQELPQTIADATEAATSPAAARAAVMARVRRYAPVAAGAAIGSVGGPMGTLAGAASGKVAQPGLQAMVRMTKDPAVQRQAMEALESGSGGLADALSAAAPAAGGVGGGPLAAYVARIRAGLRGQAPAPGTGGEF